MDTVLFKNLLEKYVAGELSAQETNQFADLLEQPACLELLEAELRGSFMNDEYLTEESFSRKQRLNELIMTKIEALPVRNRIPLRGSLRQLIAYAAILLVVVGTGIYWVLTNKEDSPAAIVSAAQSSPEEDLLPGSNKAILTLADGSMIELDSAGKGQLAVQGGISIVNNGNGELIYKNADGPSTGQVLYNTMTTPRGGQYKLLLPDGSRVWLNAASSVYYPSEFPEKERKVKVSGEAYFEVAPDPSRPFIVSVNDQAAIEVLGTDFNINSYSDESSINTTLIRGSISVRQGEEKLLLKPGEQSQQKMNEKINLLKQADLEKVMAWRNGFFNFEGASLETAMRQLSRWYDIEVAYESGIPNIEFVGKMSRNVSLSGVLSGLKGAGVRFRVEGRKLTVLK